MNVVILVPRRSDRGHRDKLWRFARPHWEAFGWPIFEGHYETNEGAFNRSRAINRAARQAGEWEVAVVVDSDVLPNPDGVQAAVACAQAGRAASGYNVRKNLTRVGTDRVLRGYRGNWEPLLASTWPLCMSGALAVPRPLWNEIGGFGEAWVGWFGEDEAFTIACETVQGQPVWQAPADLFHLWHVSQPEAARTSPLYHANRLRLDRYQAAKGDRVAIDVLLDEERQAHEVEVR